jgi:hypothetical protein
MYLNFNLNYKTLPDYRSFVTLSTDKINNLLKNKINNLKYNARMIFALQKELQVRNKNEEPLKEEKKLRITDLLSKEGKYTLAHMNEFKRGIEANYNLNLFEEKNKEINKKINKELENYKNIKEKYEEVLKKMNDELKIKDNELKIKEEEFNELDKASITLVSGVKNDLRELQKDFDQHFEFRKNQSLDYLDKKIKKLEKIKSLKKEISLQDFNNKNHNFILKNQMKEKIIEKNIEYLKIKKEKQKEINDLIIEKNKIILSARKQAYEEKMNYLKNKKNYTPRSNKYEKQIRNLENRIKRDNKKKFFTTKEYNIHMNDIQKLKGEKLFNEKYQKLFVYRGGSPNYCYAHNIPKGQKEIDPSKITFGEYLKKQLTQDGIFKEFFNNFSRIRVTDRESLDSVLRTIIKSLLVKNEF